MASTASATETTSSNNLKWLDDIKMYYNAHTSDFNQVYFSPASVTATSTTQKIAPSVKPLKSVPGFHNLQTCTLNAAHQGANFFALEPKTGRCDIYSASQIDASYNMPGTPEIVWETPIPDATEYICLDMVGNLNAYDINHQNLKTLLPREQSSLAARETSSSLGRIEDSTAREQSSLGKIAGRFHLVLLDSDANKLQPLRIRDSKNDAALTVITLPTIKELVSNPDWEQDANALKHSMSNTTAQVRDKRISVDKITATQSLVSTNYKYRLGIRNNKLILEAMIRDTRQIYKTNVDNKVGKLFYASSYPEYQFLKEVPLSMQTLGSSYVSYDEIYPDLSANYTTVKSDNCAEECNKSSDCKAVFAVTDSKNQKMCYLMPNAPTVFNPKSSIPLKTSELKIKNPVILTNSNNMEYSKASYIEDGYKSQFSAYVPGEPLSAGFIPGPKGAPYVQDLYNKIRISTFGKGTEGSERISDSTAREQSSLGARETGVSLGKEGFVINDVISRLTTAKTEADKYYRSQSDISNNVAAIDAKVVSINAKYNTMATDTKYDFTGKEIQKFGLDKYSMNTALENDTGIYTFEQNKLYAIMGITMATLLVTAIIIK